MVQQDEHFCLECLKRSPIDWMGDKPLQIKCQPIPANIEGSRYEYLALVWMTHVEFENALQPQEPILPQEHHQALTQIVRNLTSNFVAAIETYQQQEVRKETCIVNVCENLKPRTARKNFYQQAQNLYAEAIKFPRLRPENAGWEIWETAICQFNEEMMVWTERFDQSQNDFVVRTKLQEWLECFPLPLKPSWVEELVAAHPLWNLGDWSLDCKGFLCWKKEKTS
ncbi:hypothetical protein N7539_008823 [Penicillium diatomitis]|uniref:Uncharacterized protein n=1 Tax=Penicillium diatomitis TaxID=2819901 RepID=A0A9W9WQL5_9EURO|nr:uncharacterized protein N7539_008823 [Penicillium diatomitis]KAJ5471880.1 hypothetical protein N7539_008823 [Penicillium diatomitis]